MTCDRCGEGNLLLKISASFIKCLDNKAKRFHLLTRPSGPGHSKNCNAVCIFQDLCWLLSFFSSSLICPDLPVSRPLIGPPPPPFLLKPYFFTSSHPPKNLVCAKNFSIQTMTFTLIWISRSLHRQWISP